MNKNFITLILLFLAGACLGGWTNIAPLLSRRSDMSCTVSGNQIFLTGGCASDQVYEFNYSACDQISSRTDIYFPEADKWQTTSNMPRQRHRHVTLAHSNKLYVFGGRDTDDNLITAIDVFFIANNTWITLGVQFERAVSDFAGYVVGGKAVLFGGYLANYDVSNATHVFDLTSETFEYDVAQMRNGRGDICAVVLEGKGYTYGGFSTDFCSPNDHLEMFDLSTRTWVNAPVFTDATNGGDGACASLNGRFLTVGGETKVTLPGVTDCYSDALVSVESYDPATKKWAQEADLTLPDPRFRFCGVNYAEKIFIFGGQGPLERKGNHSTHALLGTAQVYFPAPASASAQVLPSLLAVLASLAFLLLA